MRPSLIPLCTMLALGACAGPLDDASRDEQPRREPQPITPAPEETVEPAGVDGLPDGDDPVEQADPPSADRADRPAWWMPEPSLGQHGFIATVEADADSVAGARAAALEEASKLVADAYAAQRTDFSVEKTLITSPSPGLYRAFVYVACPAPVNATAQAGETP